MSIKIIFTDSDLASRRSAARFRVHLEQGLQSGGAILDFSNVESISESFADELLGVLVSNYSLPWLFERVELHGLDSNTAHTLVSAIRYRLDAKRGDPIEVLSVAKEALRRKRASSFGASRTPCPASA